MKLEHILSEQDIPYSGEIDPKISHIHGKPWSMYVNQLAGNTPHNINFAITSLDDDGVIWEVPLEEPQGTSMGYKQPSMHGPGGHDMHWQRDPSRERVIVHNDTQDPRLQAMVDPITKHLQTLADNNQLDKAYSLFKKAINTLNDPSAP